MRGIVTLAAALALPGGDHPFPGRAPILITAFTVVVGTLVLQGLTLGPLVRWLDLRDDQPVEREVDVAREAALGAALKTLDGNDSEAARVLRFELGELLAMRAGDDGRSAETQRLRRQAVDGARAELKRLRFDETIGDDAYHQLEVTLDRGELYAETGRADDRSSGDAAKARA